MYIVIIEAANVSDEMQIIFSEMEGHISLSR